MKIIILFLLFGILGEGCRLRDKYEIEILSDATGLKIPGGVTDIHCKYVKNDDYNYPYDFYSRFKCDSEGYWIIWRQIFAGDQTGSNDTNIYLNSRMLANDKAYLYAYNQIDWWDLLNTVKPEGIYVNYFEDRGGKRIGDSTRFNGKIAIYYHKPYCYLYILCYPPG